MPELSLAAQAVLDAAYSELDYVPQRYVRWCAAAALRAVADQVVPHEKAPFLMRGPDLERLAQRQHTRAQMLALIAELE